MSHGRSLITSAHSRDSDHTRVAAARLDRKANFARDRDLIGRDASLEEVCQLLNVLQT